jgi:hypothetical protein
VMADGLAAKVPVKEIAAGIGRTFQTVYREIAGGAKPDGRYQPWWAYNQAVLRRRRPKTRRILVGTPLWQAVDRRERLCRRRVIGLEDRVQLRFGGLLGLQQPVPVTVSARTSASSGDGTVTARQCVCS